MDEITEKRYNHLEAMLEWIFSIKNDYNRKRLFSDEQIVKFIDDKLKINEENYDD